MMNSIIRFGGETLVYDDSDIYAASGRHAWKLLDNAIVGCHASIFPAVRKMFHY